MISLPTRIFCAAMSTVGAAGLVFFANPAVALGTPGMANAPAAIAATTVAATAHRG